MIKVNEYFSGSVKSLAYNSAEGPSTIGVFDPGTYEFGTSSHERVIIIEGELEVQLPGMNEWNRYSQGEEFQVEANKKFQARAASQVSYLCKYS